MSNLLRRALSGREPALAERLAWTWLLPALLSLACGGAPAASSAPAGVYSEPGDFAFGVLDGSVVTAENSRGRVTALLFVTTYDLPSQVAAKRVDELVRRHQPRMNAVCVVLEAADNAVLAEAFRDALHLAYPVAIADVVELRASAAFSNIDRVPTLVLLDRRGRERLRRFGLFEAEELAAWVERAEH